MIKERNKLLNLYGEMHEIMLKCKFTEWYSKTDIANNLKVYDQVKDTGLTDHHKFYDIPKKNHDLEKYEDGELTE